MFSNKSLKTLNTINRVHTSIPIVQVLYIKHFIPKDSCGLVKYDNEITEM